MWFVLAMGSLTVSFAVLVFLGRVTKVRYVPAYVTVLAFVAFFIPAITVVLLPIDLASGRSDALVRDGTSRIQMRPLSYLEPIVLLKLWRVLYWLSFALTLTILPITQSFVESGYREPMARLVSSLRQNLRYQAIYLSIGLFGILYIVLNTKLNSFADFKSLLIALANTWGLFLAINLLGHGLVNLPRRIWRSADYRTQIRDVEIRAAVVHEKLEDAIDEETELAAQVVSLERTTANKEWLEDMAALIPGAVATARATRTRPTSSWFGSRRRPQDPASDDVGMATLMARIRKNKRERYAAEWVGLVRRYTYLLDCTSGSRHDRVLTHRTFRSRLSPRAAFLYYLYLLPTAKRSLAILCGTVSCALLWSELFLHSEAAWGRLITLPITYDFRGGGGDSGNNNNNNNNSSSTHWSSIEFGSGLLLTYLATCVYSTLLRLKIFDRYALLDHGHTTPASLFFYASYCCRLTIPLSYHFITLLPREWRDQSIFSRFLADAIDLQPLGTAFNDWFPLYILLPVTLTLGNSYDRLRRTFGIAGTWIDEEDEDADNAGSSGGSGSGSSAVAEGRNLLRTHLERRYGGLITSTSTTRPDFSGRRERDINLDEDAADNSPFLDRNDNGDNDHDYDSDPLNDRDRADVRADRGLLDGPDWSLWRGPWTSRVTRVKDKLSTLVQGVHHDPDVV